jgi:hypothetical protein
LKIFLDFDGVLRRDSSPKSRLDADCIQHLESAVLSHQDARVVIASTWRLVHRIDDLRRLFSAEFATRIEGVTPDLPDAEEYVRQAEIRAYLSREGLHGIRWIAIDDDPEQFRSDAPLIKVDPALGFDNHCAQKLLAWLAQA